MPGIFDREVVDDFSEIETSKDWGGGWQVLHVSTRVVPTTVRSTYRLVVIAFVEYTQKWHYRRVELRRYKRLAGAWWRVPDQAVRASGNEIDGLVATLQLARNDLDEVAAMPGYPWLDPQDTRRTAVRFRYSAGRDLPRDDAREEPPAGRPRVHGRKHAGRQTRARRSERSIKPCRYAFPEEALRAGSADGPEPAVPGPQGPPGVAGQPDRPPAEAPAGRRP